MTDSYNVGYSVDALGDLCELQIQTNKQKWSFLCVKTRAPFLYE